jgi:hypothetical protein
VADRWSLSRMSGPWENAAGEIIEEAGTPVECADCPCTTTTTTTTTSAPSADCCGLSGLPDQFNYSGDYSWTDCETGEGEDISDSTGTLTRTSPTSCTWSGTITEINFPPADYTYTYPATLICSGSTWTLYLDGTPYTGSSPTGTWFSYIVTCEEELYSSIATGSTS